MRTLTVTTLAFAAALAGCSSGFLSGEKVDYRSGARQTTGLEVPPDLTQLAREGRGAAVVSESLNSNTLNILAGLCLPAVLLGLTPISGLVEFAVFWLLTMKLVALAASSRKAGLQRSGGVLLVALYLVFAVVVLVRS